MGEFVAWKPTGNSCVSHAREDKELTDSGPPTAWKPVGAVRASMLASCICRLSRENRQAKHAQKRACYSLLPAWKPGDRARIRYNRGSKKNSLLDMSPRTRWNTGGGLLFLHFRHTHLGTCLLRDHIDLWRAVTNWLDIEWMSGFSFIHLRNALILGICVNKSVVIKQVVGHPCLNATDMLYPAI